MSISGTNYKQINEKSNVGGRKFQSVIISSVYSGKSLLSQKTSAPVKHGLQSLGKASAVPRRMPPPTDLPSLKSECAGQDPNVSIVPSGAQGWASSTAPSSTSLVVNKSIADTGQIPADVQLHQPAANAASASSIAQSALSVAASTVHTAASRPTWSTRIGPTTAVATLASPSANAVTTAAVAVPVGSSSAAANYFASMVNQDFPKLSNESEKVVAAGPSLRPQKVGGWKSGAVNASEASQQKEISSSGEKTTDVDSDSPSPSPLPPSQYHALQHLPTAPPFANSVPYPGHRGGGMPMMQSPRGPPPPPHIYHHHHQSLPPYMSGPPPHPPPHMSMMRQPPPNYVPVAHPPHYGHHEPGQTPGYGYCRCMCPHYENYGAQKYAQKHRQQSSAYPPNMNRQSNQQNVRDPRSLEVEEEEERMWQRDQQYAREIAIEKSRQKRLGLHKSSVSSSGAHDSPTAVDDNYAAAPIDAYESDRNVDDSSEGNYRPFIDKIDDRPARNRDMTNSQSKMDHSEIDEVDDRQFQVLKRTTAVVRRTLETAPVKCNDQKEQPQKQAPITSAVAENSQRTTTDEDTPIQNIRSDPHKSKDDEMINENKADSVNLIENMKEKVSAKKDLGTIENTKSEGRNSEKVESKSLSRENRTNEPRERRSAFRPKVYINRSSYNYYNEKPKIHGERREKYENYRYEGRPLEDEHLGDKVDQERENQGPYQGGRSNSRRGQQQQFTRSNSQRRSSYGYNSRNPNNDRFNNERPQMRAYRETHDDYDGYYQSYYYRNDSNREPHSGGYSSRSARGVTNRGSSRRTGMPPRFTVSRKGAEEKNAKQSEQKSLEKSEEQEKPKNDHRNQNDDESRVRDVPSFNHGGKNLQNQSHITNPNIRKNYRHDGRIYNVKSPKTDTLATNQSEGNDEWETASESSDVTERKQMSPDKKEAWSEKQQSTKLRSASGAYTHRRRGAYNDRFDDIRNDQHENYRKNWNPDNGLHRKPSNRSNGRQVLNNKSARQAVDVEVCQKATEIGSKNYQVASRSHNNDNSNSVVTQSRLQIQKTHHHNQHTQRRRLSSNAMAVAITADAIKQLQQQTKMRHLQQQTSTKNGAPVQPAVAKKRPSGAGSDEKSNGVKLDVLATVNLNNIAGVVVIDDQPDVGGVCDNQEGFQEVMSKKERRNRKELLNNVEIEKKVPVSTHSSKIRDNRTDSKKQQAHAKIHADTSHKKENSKHENVNSQGKGKIDMWQPVHTKIIDQNEPHSDPNVQKTSKTGVEVWGTPDLAPFSGVVLPSEKPPVLKCVVRPTKHGDERASIGTPEFPFEVYGANGDDFSTSKMSIENLSEAFDKPVVQATKPDEHRTASVEFVFDTFNVSQCHNDVPDSNVIEFVSEELENQTVKLTDEQESSSNVVELLCDGYSINSTEQMSTKPIDFSFDGFNDCRKQLEENTLTKPVEMMFDGFSNVVPSMSMQNVPKAHSTVPTPQTLDLFGMAGSRPSQYLFHHANVQTPQNSTVLIAATPQSPLDICRQVPPTGGANNAPFAATSLNGGDLYAAFGANPARQHVTAPIASALHNFNVGPAKGPVSSTPTAAAATAFLLPENGLSLFTQPPPAIARGAPMQPSTHGLYTFPQAPINAPRAALPPSFIAQVQHPPPPTLTANGPSTTKYISAPQGVVPSLLNGGSGASSASRNFLTGSINANGKPTSINLAANVGPFNNWATGPAPHHSALQSKVFNPTIGPPNAHPSKLANVPGVYGAVFNLTASNVLTSNGNFAAFSSKKSSGSANVINLPKNQPNYVTNQDFACYTPPQYRQNSNLLSMIEQQQQQAAAPNLNLNINLNMNASGFFHLKEDFKKRDGDLLQKMDHFINSTNGSEDEILLARANEKSSTAANESDLAEKAPVESVLH